MTLQHNYLVILLQGGTNLNSFCASGLQANEPRYLFRYKMFKKEKSPGSSHQVQIVLIFV